MKISFDKKQFNQLSYRQPDGGYWKDPRRNPRLCKYWKRLPRDRRVGDRLFSIPKWRCDRQDRWAERPHVPDYLRKKERKKSVSFRFADCFFFNNNNNRQKNVPWKPLHSVGRALSRPRKFSRWVLRGMTVPWRWRNLATRPLINTSRRATMKMMKSQKH